MSSVIKIVKDTTKQFQKGVGDIFEKTIENPVKKLGKETFDTLAGTTDEERRFLLGDTPESSPEITPEVTPEVAPDDDTLMGRGRRRTKGKRSGGAGTLMEGYGVTYARPNPKAPTGSG